MAKYICNTSSILIYLGVRGDIIKKNNLPMEKPDEKINEEIIL